MPRSWLKPLRLAAAVLVLAGLTAAFLDFRGLVPAPVAHGLAAVQFTPALLALGTGTVAAVVFAALLVGTLAFGRVYCSIVCPLGLLQDAVARVAGWLRPRRHPWRFVRENRWLRYGVLAAVLAAVAGGAGAFTFALVDPYGHFGRIVSGLFRPLLVATNNALVPAAQALGFQGLYHVTPPWPGAAILLSAGGAGLLVAGLAAWRGRIFCNTLCPVGTVLGQLARFALFRLTLDRDACTKCTACLRACKAQCLDLRAGTIDAARCVACFNCLTACPEHGIRHEFAWRRPPPKPAPAPAPAAAVTDPTRRALLAGAAALVLAPGRAHAEGHRHRHQADGKQAGPVTPPGSGGTERFLAHCTACQLCVSACPTQVLQPALLEYGLTGLAKPRLDFHRAFCNFDCRRCGEVCPTGAIALLGLEEKQQTSIGLARFEQSRCIVETDGTDCAACSEHCPTKAVDTVPFRENLRLPRVNHELCLGCGACEYACPVRPQRAIIVEARPRHTGALRAPAAPPAARPSAGDFPF